MTHNAKSMNVKMRRIDLCNLLIACQAAAEAVKADGESGQRWEELHDKLQAQLRDFDEKHQIE